MTITEYSRVIDNTVLSWDGNDISDSCKEFLEGILDKKIANRFTFEQTVSHPWVVNIKERIDDISMKHQTDPEKMISELNKTRLSDEYFKKKDYFEMPLSEEDSCLINKKRKRSSKN
jgi:hypothetical protein